jgi:glutamate-1-semialdehyde aminotransferase
MEPIICNLGAVVPEDEFVRGVRKLCTRYGTLFIADEVATGLAGPESSSPASTSISSPTSCAWPRPSPAATADSAP